MAQPVWVLSVDLQAKTAVFQSGMADAAKSARGAFTDIKSGSGEMGREMGGNMMEARHGVMLLGEEFGIHLPRALTTFIASIGPIGAAMEAAFPFLAVAVGATLLIEALVKMHEAGEKLTTDQVKFGTAVQTAFNSLDMKLLQSGIRADELRNDHLGALAKQLQLIDMQSMAELEKTFGELAKAADGLFQDLKSHWYTFGIGATGAKYALDEFQVKYNDLLANNRGDEASDLLKGTRDSAQKVLDAMNTANAKKPQMGTGSDEAWKANLEYGKAMNVVKAAGLEGTEKELAAQQALVQTLNAQVEVEGKIAALKKSDSANVTRTDNAAMAAQASAAARAAADSQLRIDEQKLAAAKAVANAQIQMQSMGADEREAIETAFADRELQIRLAANTAQIAALDKFAKDYPNQLKALHEKAEELEQQHATAVAEIQAKSAVENNNESRQALEQGIRESIEATQQGTAARLAAIEDGIKAEQARGMSELAAFRDLQNQRVEVIRQMTEEENKLRAEAAHEAADNDEKMGQLALAAERDHQALLNSSRRISDQMRMQQQIQAANAEYALKLTAAAQDIAALDKTGKDYENKLKAIQDKEKQLIQQHENEITQIKDKAEEERNTRILSADEKFNDSIARGLTQVLMGHKSFAAQMSAIGNQVVAGMLENAIKSILTDDMTKERDAAAAARKAYLAGASMGPAGIVLGPVFGAAAFAAVMAFENGTDSVPGIGRGDSIPAMLTPGEGVVPGGVMDGLRKMVSSGNMGGSVTHVHVSPTYHLQALDGDGIDKVLDTHSYKLQKHFEGVMRKKNLL